MKIVGKSIRDRVALIKWRRARTGSPNGNSEVKKMQQNLLQVPGTGPPEETIFTTADCEDQETLICTVPVITPATCKKLNEKIHLWCTDFITSGSCAYCVTLL